MEFLRFFVDFVTVSAFHGIIPNSAKARFVSKHLDKIREVKRWKT